MLGPGERRKWPQLVPHTLLLLPGEKPSCVLAKEAGACRCLKEQCGHSPLSPAEPVGRGGCRGARGTGWAWDPAVGGTEAKP